jgi:peptide deformylase
MLGTGGRVAVLPIVQYPDDRLRQKCKRITRLDQKLQRLVDDMIDTMQHAHGVGLAAPQVGVLLRLCVIQLPEEHDDPRAGELIVLYNPEIVKATGEWTPEEGCLSLPGYVANVRRAYTVSVKGRDRHGREIRVKGSELLGQALQHEIDHLNGVLFIDHLDSPEQLRRIGDSPETAEDTYVSAAS